MLDNNTRRTHAGEKENEFQSRLALKYSFSQQTWFQLSFIVHRVNTYSAVDSANRARCVSVCMSSMWLSVIRFIDKVWFQSFVWSIDLEAYSLEDQSEKEIEI